MTSYNGIWLNGSNGLRRLYRPDPGLEDHRQDRVQHHLAAAESSGRSSINPGLRFDLDTFERTQFRLKLAVQLN